ncbi:BMC domain-containing protein [Furfurilactobacillus siliginis]|uniref:BMC domain-containing protein n=1 Tax=Furfurilactobacillus siliginis TaxID=348151 RepID=A0A0R2L3E8_9LACO|nr:BMC domain-containing protein [Furfurilactobacillus siliginis]KRN96219.1 hypothetical protein IV55_GL001605 [Furfurilactobacillus siliginis]GEK27856.1 hypothetical protein LSI01_01670 [Furfurilactobacillus siliginis]
MSEALGMVEVGGFSTVVKVADVMVKTANVHIEKIERARGAGQMTVFVSGDVGAVNAAVAAGANIAADVDKFVAKQIIPRPAAGIDSLVKAAKNFPTAVSETVDSTKEVDTPVVEKPESVKEQATPASQAAKPESKPATTKRTTTSRRRTNNKNTRPKQ